MTIAVSVVGGGWPLEQCRCAACHEQIISSLSRYVDSSGRAWHMECFGEFYEQSGASVPQRRKHVARVRRA
jgi:hypothetical protein